MSERNSGFQPEPNLYVIPAHVEHTTYGSHVYEDHREPSEWRDKMDADLGRRVENCAALLISEWGNDSGEDITPDADRPGIIDGELAPRELTP